MNRQTASQAGISRSCTPSCRRTSKRANPLHPGQLRAELRENLSPATVRNIMADLYEEGYLAQPHTSAGRIPTEKAFKSYVHSLYTASGVFGRIGAARTELSDLETMQARVERSSHIVV